jgi:hypothetical protein
VSRKIHSIMKDTNNFSTSRYRTIKNDMPSLMITKDLRENNLSTFATRFGSDLDGTIEEKPRHSRAMLRLFSIEVRSKMDRRLAATCPSYFLSSPNGSTWKFCPFFPSFGIVPKICHAGVYFTQIGIGLFGSPSVISISPNF